MANVFSKEEEKREVPSVEIVRETLNVNATGDVTFRSRRGRGTGKAVTIPAGQFDEFVSLMVQTQASREALAEQERDAAAAATEAGTETSETDSE